MGQTLSKAPVYFVAAQIRHNPIYVFADVEREKFDQVKTQLRVLGYSDQKILQPSSKIESRYANVEFKEPKQFIALNADNNCAFVILENRFFFQTTNYRGFDGFKGIFLKGFSIFHEAFKVNYIESMSMRMLDAIEPSASEQLSDYLPSELLGLANWAEQRNWNLSHQSSEHLFNTENNIVVLRCVRRPDSLTFPPGLLPFGMQLQERHKNIARPHAVLDMDAAYEFRQSEIDLEKLAQKFSELKKDISQCFKGIVKPEALEKWK